MGWVAAGLLPATGLNDSLLAAVALLHERGLFRPVQVRLPSWRVPSRQQFRQTPNEKLTVQLLRQRVLRSRSPPPSLCSAAPRARDAARLVLDRPLSARS